MSEVLFSQLAYAELISPKPEETVRWMHDVLGLEETARDGQSVYMRGWAEWLHSSLIVTEGPEPAMARTGWRAYGPGDPEIVAKKLKGTDAAIGWVEAGLGRGSAYRYKSPAGGQVHEILWEMDLYEAPEDKQEPALTNRPQRFSERGAAVRYLDHVTVPSGDITRDVEFYNSLGFRYTASTEFVPGFSVFTVLTSSGIRHTHDLALVPDFSGLQGRGHHIAFRVDQRGDVERAAEVCLANNTPIEYGPGIHGIDEITFLYVREPGGYRIEINAGGWVNQMPDYKPGIFGPIPGVNLYQTSGPPEAFTHGFPPLTEEQQAKNMAGFVKAGLQNTPTETP